MKHLLRVQLFVNQCFQQKAGDGSKIWKEYCTLAFLKKQKIGYFKLDFFFQKQSLTISKLIPVEKGNTLLLLHLLKYYLMLYFAPHMVAQEKSGYVELFDHANFSSIEYLTY